MSAKFIAAAAVLTAFTAPAAFGQGQPAQKASKAEVEKLAAVIKGDKAKLSEYCEIAKLSIQAGQLAQKNEKDPKLADLDKQMDAIASKLGPDYERITNSDLDQDSAAVLYNLSASCDLGAAVPKASKAEVQKVADGIKRDPTKLAEFCELTKLAGQAGALAQKNPDDPKLEGMAQQIDGLVTKLGPDYAQLSNSELDETSSAPLSELSKSCK